MYLAHIVIQWPKLGVILSSIVTVTFICKVIMYGIKDMHDTIVSVGVNFVAKGVELYFNHNFDKGSHAAVIRLILLKVLRNWFLVLVFYQ